MEVKTKNALLVAGGFLLGTIGVKALTSDTARRGYVQAVALGLQAKQGYEDIVEEAKAEVDDIVAEANYINLESRAEAEEKEEKTVAKKTTARAKK